MTWKHRALPRCPRGQTNAPRESIASYFLARVPRLSGAAILQSCEKVFGPGRFVRSQFRDR
eukprot:8679028-Alexandrium_andersonii.AAC.1